MVQEDGSIFNYNGMEPNAEESDIEIGTSVWVGFQSYEYTEGNGKYNRIYAYRVSRDVD